MDLPELFRRAFFTRTGLLRLLVIVVVAAVVGVLLGLGGASPGVRSLVFIVGAIVAGTLLFIPAYRR